ncbi:MAG: hypothetical protein HC853_06015 [Anaerolineae bacterium]|nr:hypothetical protein [Anaerolineae bacterium]
MGVDKELLALLEKSEPGEIVPAPSPGLYGFDTSLRIAERVITSRVAQPDFRVRQRERMNRIKPDYPIRIRVASRTGLPAFANGYLEQSAPDLNQDNVEVVSRRGCLAIRNFQ